MEGRVVLQLFPECPLQPTVPYRGMIEKLLPVTRTGEHAGEFWVSIRYEDDDKEARELGELGRNARLVPFSEMSSAELSAASPSALAAELTARGVAFDDATKACAKSLAQLLSSQLRPEADRAADDAADDAAHDAPDGDPDDAPNDPPDPSPDASPDPSPEDENAIPDDADWGERMAAFNAKQIAELGQLQANVGEATARLKRLHAVLERVAYQPDEAHTALVSRIERLPAKEQRALALALQQEVEDISYAQRVPADKLILWRARDLLHNRSITIARYWFKGSLTAQKIDAVRNHIVPRLEAALQLQLSGVLIPRLLFLVADKESCNEVLALKGRPDGVPPTPRELAKEVERTALSAKREKPAMLLCDKHWDDPEQPHLSTSEQQAASLLGFDRDTWIADEWDAVTQDWHELNIASRCAAQQLGFDASSWWGSGAQQAHASAEQGRAELSKKRSALSYFLSRAPSKLPPMVADVLGMQLLALPLDWRPPWRRAPPLEPPESAAVRTCVTSAIANVMR